MRDGVRNDGLESHLLEILLAQPVPAQPHIPAVQSRQCSVSANSPFRFLGRRSPPSLGLGRLLQKLLGVVDRDGEANSRGDLAASAV